MNPRTEPAKRGSICAYLAETVGKLTVYSVGNTEGIHQLRRDRQAENGRDLKLGPQAGIGGKNDLIQCRLEVLFSAKH